MVGFRDAMDQLRLSANEVAELFGLAPQTVRQMRLDPDNPHHRTPPSNWRQVFVRVAQERVPVLHKLIDELQQRGPDRG